LVTTERGWQWFGVEEFPWPVALEKWSWAAAGPAEEVGMSGKARTAGTTGRVVEDPRWVGLAAAGRAVEADGVGAKGRGREGEDWSGGPCWHRR